MTFVDKIQDKLEKGKTLILPEVSDERVILATAQILKENFCKLLIIAKDESEKQNLISKLKNENVTDNQLENSYFVLKSDKINDFTEFLFELRKEKGMTKEEALELLSKENNLYFATILLKQGQADGIVAGSNSATADVIRPALQIIKPKEGIKTVSSYFIMYKEDAEEEKKLLIFSDCGLNINPSSEQLADIAISSAENARKFGLVPKVALLSCSTKGSASHPDIEKVQEAKNILDKKRESCEEGIDFEYDGELQVDTALIKSIAEKKSPNGMLKGDANVLIFPDLDAGNIAYKLTERLGGYEALGPFIQGLAKPVNDLSRGCSVEDIVNVAKLTLI